MEASVLLDVAELLEAAIAIGAAVRFFARVHSDVLDQLVVGRERLETLLALVRLRFAPVGVPGVHLHRRLGHENLHKNTTSKPHRVREEAAKDNNSLDISLLLSSSGNVRTRNQRRTRC